MTAGSLNINTLVDRLERTRVPLREVCEELDLDYDNVVNMELGISQCTHCGIWSKRLILDLDENPICSVCRDIAGL
jgi:uncharacterized protein (UPF0212 family)